ncbi:hypothetical protein ACJX0J_017710, partial [Zea mays]
SHSRHLKRHYDSTTSLASAPARARPVWYKHGGCGGGQQGESGAGQAAVAGAGAPEPRDGRAAKAAQAAPGEGGGRVLPGEERPPRAPALHGGRALLPRRPLPPRCDRPARRAERQRDGARVLMGVQEELPERLRVARPGGRRLHPPGGRPGVRAQGHRAPAPGAAAGAAGRGGRVLLVVRLAGDAHLVVLCRVGGARQDGSPDEERQRVWRGRRRARGVRGVQGRGARRGRRDADRGRRPRPRPQPQPEARPGSRRAGGAEQGGDDVAADGVHEPRDAGGAHQGGRARCGGRQRQRPGQGVLRAHAAHLVRVRVRAGRLGGAARAGAGTGAPPPPPPPPRPPPAPPAGVRGRRPAVVPRQDRGGQGVLQREHHRDREALAGRRRHVPGPGRSPALVVVQRGEGDKAGGGEGGRGPARPLHPAEAQGQERRL